MAKQLSWKQEMYQQLANSQVQQILNEQHNQDLQMAQNLISQYQPSEDDLNFAQNLISQYQPVQQANVNQVKAKSAPKQEQIPSLEDFFKPKTASGIDVNKTASNKIQREDYQRQQQLENMLADPKNAQKAEDLNNRIALETFNKKDSGLVGGGLNQLDLSGYQAAIDKAKQQSNEELERQILNADKYVVDDIPQLTDEQKALEEQIANFDEYQINKSNPEESRDKLAAYGWGASKLPFMVSKFAVDQASKKAGNILEKGAKVADFLTGEDRYENLAKQAIEERNAQTQGNYDWMKEEQKKANEANPLAYGLGNFTTQAALYAITGPLFDGIAEGAGVTNQLAKFFINQGAQNVQDLVLDTAPLINDLMADGSMSKEDKKEVFSNVLWNAVFNAGMGVVSEIPNIKKWANTPKVTEAIPGVKEVDDVVANATKQAEDAAQNIEDISKQIPEVPEVAPIEEAVKAQPIEAVAPEIKQEAAEMAEYVGNPIIDIGSKVNSYQNEALDNAYKEVLDNYDKYAKALDSASSVEDVAGASKDLKNAINRFKTQANKVDSSLVGDIGSKKFSTQIDSFTNRMDDVLNGERRATEAAEAIADLEGNKILAEDVGLEKAQPEIESAKWTGQLEETPTEVKPTMPESEVVPPEGMKERGQSRHIRNDGTPMKMEGVSEEVAADFKDNPDMYTVLKNADTKAKAEEIYRTSEDPLTQFRDMVKAHDPAALPLGHQLAKDFSANGNYAAASQIYREMGEQLTKAGQFSQAAVINMMKNDPLTAMNYAERQIASMNEQGLKRFGKKWKNFELTDAEKALFNNIKPGDEDAIKAAFDQIGTRLGKEYPTTFMDKLLEGRKIAMLFNVRTNVRNVGANVPTLGMRWTADRLEAVGQNIAHIINPEIQVTQSLTGSGIQGRKLATEAFNSKRVQSLLEDTPGKYEIPELKNSLVQNKQMYKGTKVEKWIDNITGGGIQKLNEKLFGKTGVQSGLETVRNATYKLLDLGDSPFVKENFVERLGSYIKAQGIKNIDDIPDEAIQLAYEEAMKATYKDNSWAVQMLSGIKNKGLEKIPGIGRPISQAAIPFVQAPGNIAARMIDYSPIKATKGVGDIIAGAVKSDAKQVSKGIEEAAKGLTGTGLIVLGMKLRESGLLTGTYSEDADQKAFEKQNGFKQFALHIGDKYFTYDWAQPFAQSLMVGTLLADAIEKSDEYNSELLDYLGVENPIADKALGVTREGAKEAINAWFDASPLQGLQELMSGGYGNKDGIAGNLASVGIGNFAGALVPSSVNAVAKSMDPVQRNTTDKTNWVANFVNQQQAKIPGLSEDLPAKYDTWGREMRYAENKAMATASRFLIPGDYSYDRSDEVDNEINRLYEEATDSEGNLLKDVGVFPQVAPNAVGDKKLNNAEVSEFQKDMGTRSREIAEEFVKSDAYKNMKDEDKVEYLKKIYGLSQALTKEKFGAEISKSSEYKKLAETYKEGGIDALIKAFQSKAFLDSADISSSSNAGKEITEALAKGNTAEAERLAYQEKQYNAACEKAGVTDKNAGTRKAYDEGGVKGLQEYVKKQELVAQYDLDKNDSAKSVYDSYGEQGLKDLSEFQKYGLNTKTPIDVYNNAKKENIVVPSIKTFAETYSKIDGYGTGKKKNDGKINQDEFKSFLNSGNYTQEQAEYYAALYGDWSTYITRTNKGWEFKRKKK